MSEALMIFAKAPVAGRAKTRLIPAVGPEGAAALHEAFALDVIERHQRPGRGLTVWRAGAVDHPFWTQIQAPQTDQPAGDLGRRMLHAFTETLQSAERVVILGTDSPTLPPAFVDEAFAALAEHDIVIGPANDGGYYLMGLSCVPSSRLFEAIAWGGERVLVETLERVAELGLSLKLLPFWYDVDRPEDLALFRRHVPLLMAAGIPAPERSMRAIKDD